MLAFCAGIAFACLAYLIGAWAINQPGFRALTQPPPSALRFAEPHPLVMRQPLIPQGLSAAQGGGLILTHAATGQGAMVIHGPEALSSVGALASVDHLHLTDLNAAAAVVFTLGLAARNWKTFALLLQDGEVVDRITCWSCAQGDADFKGADIDKLIAAARPVSSKDQQFDSQAAFDAALARARQDPGIWIDRKHGFGKNGNVKSPTWHLTTWEVAQ